MGNLSGGSTNELEGWPAAQADSEQMQTAVMENLLTPGQIVAAVVFHRHPAVEEMKEDFAQRMAADYTGAAQSQQQQRQQFGRGGILGCQGKWHVVLVVLLVDVATSTKSCQQEGASAGNAGLRRVWNSAVAGRIVVRYLHSTLQKQSNHRQRGGAGPEPAAILHDRTRGHTMLRASRMKKGALNMTCVRKAQDAGRKSELHSCPALEKPHPGCCISALWWPVDVVVTSALRQCELGHLAWAGRWRGKGTTEQGKRSLSEFIKYQGNIAGTGSVSRAGALVPLITTDKRPGAEGGGGREGGQLCQRLW
ncbi:hypothetical protein INR49_016673 [Caranx melampygus]|nr:hypothetical protein INR49_016673 [Caranx melampygus]